MSAKAIRSLIAPPVAPAPAPVIANAPATLPAGMPLIVIKHAPPSVEDDPLREQFEKAKRLIPTITHFDIKRIVAEHYGISVTNIISRKRRVEFVFPRQVAIYFVRECCPGFSLPQIGLRFGGIDHTTALHAVRKVMDMRNSDPDFAETIAQIRAKIDDLLHEREEAASIDIRPYDEYEATTYGPIEPPMIRSLRLNLPLPEGPYPGSINDVGAGS